MLSVMSEASLSTITVCECSLWSLRRLASWTFLALALLVSRVIRDCLKIQSRDEIQVVLHFKSNNCACMRSMSSVLLNVH